jgi:hypothetical protein
VATGVQVFFWLIGQPALFHLLQTPCASASCEFIDLKPERFRVLEQPIRKKGKTRMLQGRPACQPIQLTCASALSGWWQTVGPCEKAHGALG